MSNLTPRINRIDRNYIINGAMEYFQVAGASTPVAVSSSYAYDAPDMFETEQTGTWTSPEIGRSTTKVGTRSRRSSAFTGTPGATSDEFHMRTKIESIFAQDLISDKFSLGFQYNSSNFTQCQVIVSYANAEDNFSTTTEVLNITFTLTADSTNRSIEWANLTPVANMANGIQIEYIFKGLSDTSATTLNVGEFVLNKGNRAIDYAPAGRNQVEELSLCRRYFEKTYNTDVAVGTITNEGGLVDVHANATGGLVVNYSFHKEKRVVPTIEVYNPATGASGTFNRFSGGGDFSPTGYDSGTKTFTQAETGAWTGAVRGHFTFDARL